MISFSKLGSYGRLGNQLFQYAFLRESARRLGTSYYCPRWEGDDIFDLDDRLERAQQPIGISRQFDGTTVAGFDVDALYIQDSTEIRGYFQSERFYQDRSIVRRWYKFKDSIIDVVDRKYPNELMQNAASFSLRIDDDYANTREYFPLYPASYYERGLRMAGDVDNVIVFADRPDLAKEFFRRLPQLKIRVVRDLSAYEQLYLMTRCRFNIITNSTFAWWGAWLNNQERHQAIAPSHWCRPGVPRSIEGIISDEWTTVRGTIPVWDDFQLWRLRHPHRTMRRILDRIRRF